TPDGDGPGARMIRAVLAWDLAVSGGSAAECVRLAAEALAHGTLYFKMMDDAAFYACNSMVSDRFLLTTAFNLVFTRPLKPGPMIAEGRWVSGRRRVFVGEARLVSADGEEAARGTGTFMRSHIPLSSLEGYRPG
ncbi:MAG TPA: PaaI family thioesterase, partial [Allosphingosinicella sp.]|nr:PaaI family thioesterase [Allosphingosinicella sp.]